MTVVAYDGEMLAADTQITGEYITKGANKIFKNVGLYPLVAFAGHARLWEPTKQWIAAGSPPEACPFLGAEDQISVCAIAQDGSVVVWSEGSPFPVDCSAPFAMGSGGNFAMGALCAGASATEAVKIASKLDPYSGGGVSFATISNNQR